MKRLLLGFCLTVTYHLSFAQSYGNEWIEYEANRFYLKFKVHQNGVYRIDKANLEFAMDALSPAQSIESIDPRSIQVFAKGVEQPIYVFGENDGSFDAGDFIELFCEKNDGWLDEQLYPASGQHTNPFYSIASDTLTYFLTWSPDGVPSSNHYQNVAYNGPAVSTIPYLIIEDAQPFNSIYQEGEDLGQGKPYILYHGGKGWASNNFGYNGGSGGSGVHKTFNVANVLNNGNAPDISIEVGVCGFNRGALTGNPHHVRLRYDVGSGYNEFDDVFLDRYEYRQHTTTLPTSIIGNDPVKIQCYTSSSGAANETTSDYSIASYIKMRYPHTTSFSGETNGIVEFYTPTSSNEYHANLSNWTVGEVNAVYDISLKRRYQTNYSGTNLRFNIAPGSERKIAVATNNSVNVISGGDLRPVSDDGQFTNPDTWEKDSAFLIVAHRSLQSAAELYKSYRNTTHPGRVSLVYIGELYDQFAYGIRHHPNAIRGLCKFGYETWTSPPQHLLLLGKSIDESSHRKSTSARAQLLVPTMGYPASDNYFSLGLGSNPSASAIATGRIAARTNAQLNAYREKLRQAELAQNNIVSEYTINKKLWQKHVLHFAGGDNSVENNTFVSNLNRYANSIEQSTYGGKSFLFSKTSGTVIQQLDLDTVRDLIRDGVSIMTFFGHGTQNGFDINVDNPSTWDNQGKYPIVMANSCFSGNIHLPTNGDGGISEQYVLIPNLGAIAFIATPGLSFTRDLDNYTGQLYQQIAIDNYGKSIGYQMLQTANLTAPSTAINELDKRRISMGLEMTLHGDPGYRINPHSRSEYTINDPIQGAQFQFNPATITTDLDSFDMVLDVTNLGRRTDGSVNVKVTRSFPTSAADEVQFKTIENLGYKSEVSFRFDVNSEDGIGENAITIEVDLPADSIPEFDNLTNNTIADFNFEIIDGDITPVYPYHYGVVSDFDVTLRANTGYPFAPERSYVFQIDTTDSYDSPFFSEISEFTIEQRGAVVEWTPGLNTHGFQDSTVFFWRVAPSDDLSKWREFSFQVIQNSFGWGQAHHFQLKNNRFDFINYNKLSRKLTYEEASRDLRVTVLPNPDLANQQQTSATEFRLDGQLAPLGDYGMAPLGPPSMAIVVIDTLSLEPWGTYGISNGQLINPNHQFGNNNDYNAPFARKRVEYFFSFRIQDSASMQNMIDMINNEVPDGYYILAYTLRNAQFQNSTYWKEAHYQTFEALGADSIRYVDNINPYILLSKKGSPGLAEEVVGKSSNAVIRLNSKVFSTVKQGQMTGPGFGPAMKWGTFFSTIQGLEANNGDNATSTATGTDLKNIDSDLVSIDKTGMESLEDVNADSTLSIALSLETEDNVNGTPAQLRSWQLLAEPAPDVAVNPILGTAYRSQEVAAGETYYWGVALQNISEFDFEFLSVAYWLTEKGGRIVQSDTLRYKSMVAGATIFDSLAINTGHLNGRYTLWLEANPYGNEWHKEHYAFNNRAYKTLIVNADRSNPLLDVTFDGIHILNGDIVSPFPEIVMEVKDENQFLLMQDTSTFDVFLTYPDGLQNRIPFTANGKQIMEFEPATDKKNKARLTYRPEQLSDGTHTLMVMARDASGNNSGEDAYKIDFEVINKSMVTQVMNYPNPFTTSTQFVFTLTGSRIPDVFTIQILTVTGKVVKEITKNELGNIHIGRNITDYTWNGTDHYGDRLANGVYLYRVIMKIDGDVIDRMESGADQYFTKEFGKMYLFR